jgi:hypothetical protein
MLFSGGSLVKSPVPHSLAKAARCKGLNLLVDAEGIEPIFVKRPKAEFCPYLIESQVENKFRTFGS